MCLEVQRGVSCGFFVEFRRTSTLVFFVKGSFPILLRCVIVVLAPEVVVVLRLE